MHVDFTDDTRNQENHVASPVSNRPLTSKLVNPKYFIQKGRRPKSVSNLRNQLSRS